MARVDNFLAMSDVMSARSGALQGLLDIPVYDKLKYKSTISQADVFHLCRVVPVASNDGPDSLEEEDEEEEENFQWVRYIMAGMTVLMTVTAPIMVVALPSRAR